MTVTYVVKDLAELAKHFREKEDHLYKLGRGQKGHWPMKDRKDFLIQSAVWGQAADMLEKVRVEPEPEPAPKPGPRPGKLHPDRDLVARWAKENGYE